MINSLATEHMRINFARREIIFNRSALQIKKDEKVRQLQIRASNLIPLLVQFFFPSLK